MVFCNTLNSSRAVDHFLSEYQISTVNYHGEVPAEQRVENLKKFKSDDGDCTTLVCTDLAARGLDPDVDHVIMFDFPLTSIDYLHRTGRTARMGAKAIVPVVESLCINRLSYIPVMIVGIDDLKKEVDKRGKDEVVTSRTSQSSPRETARKGGIFRKQDIDSLFMEVSQVTWLEHVEVEERPMHQIIDEFLNSGAAFGAIKWLSVLQRQTERLHSLTSLNASDYGDKQNASKRDSSFAVCSDFPAVAISQD
ncbi:hypothetical protein AgCh_002656 [Apium graveolens]